MTNETILALLRQLAAAEPDTAEIPSHTRWRDWQLGYRFAMLKVATLLDAHKSERVTRAATEPR